MQQASTPSSKGCGGLGLVTPTCFGVGDAVAMHGGTSGSVALARSPCVRSLVFENVQGEMKESRVRVLCSDRHRQGEGARVLLAGNLVERWEELMWIGSS